IQAPRITLLPYTTLFRSQIYAATCAACHGTGVAGAPTLGDTAAWAPLLEKGYETLLQNAINGINAMPPRGGNPNLSDLEVARARSEEHTSELQSRENLVC